MDETDIPDSEMEAHFEAHREEIKAHILEWRIKIKGHLAGLPRKGHISDGLKKAVPVPNLPIGRSKPNLFDSVSDDLKLLLCADSLFESKTGSLSIPVTYDACLSLDLSKILGLRMGKHLDLAIYKQYRKAQEIARALLVGMGTTNASFLKLWSLGQHFKCGRCQSKLTHTWEEMVSSLSAVWFLFPTWMIGLALR